MKYLFIADNEYQGQTLFLAECDSQEAAKMLVIAEYPEIIRWG